MVQTIPIAMPIPMAAGVESEWSLSEWYIADNVEEI